MSMQLVSYENSDSDEESETSNASSNSLRPIENKVCKNDINLTDKKEKKPVKIVIPSLNEFKDENEDDPPKKKPKLGGGSSLLSILPPPKHSSTPSSFMPYILTKKKDPIPDKFIKKAHSISSNPSKPCNKNPDENNLDIKLKNLSQTSLSTSNLTDEENSDISSTKDFFSLNDSSEKPITADHSLIENNNYAGAVLYPQNVEIDTTKSNSLNTSSYSQESNLPNAEESYTTISYSQNLDVDNANSTDNTMNYIDNNAHNVADYNPASSSNQELSQNSLETFQESNNLENILQDEAFRKLQGRRHDLEQINFIDIKADDQLSDKTEWLMKSFSEEKNLRPSRKKGNMPSAEQRRKHQITYLAFQAKERELDLKNQWAINAHTRRQTQAKYGF